MRATPPTFGTVAELASADKVAGQDSVIARLSGETTQHRRSEDRNIAKCPSIGPANRGRLRHDILCLSREWLFLADLLNEHFLGSVALVVFPGAFPKFDGVGAVVDFAFYEHRVLCSTDR